MRVAKTVALMVLSKDVQKGKETVARLAEMTVNWMAGKMVSPKAVRTVEKMVALRAEKTVI